MTIINKLNLTVHTKDDSVECTMEEVDIMVLSKLLVQYTCCLTNRGGAEDGKGRVMGTQKEIKELKENKKET